MKFQIKNRFTDAVQYECELPTEIEALDYGCKLGFAVKKAIREGADLTWADLTWANLTGANLTRANLAGADLTRADLTRANLTWADLAGANLTGADLTRADLTWADLTWADLTRANLTEVDLTGANLMVIKEDFYKILSISTAEIPALEAAMLAGKIDGSTYSGECACLCGTIEEARGVTTSDMRNSNRPIERWFLAIQPGHTPDNNPIAKITYDWLREFKQTKE